MISNMIAYLKDLKVSPIPTSDNPESGDLQNINIGFHRKYNIILLLYIYIYI